MNFNDQRKQPRADYAPRPIRSVRKANERRSLSCKIELILAFAAVAALVYVALMPGKANAFETDYQHVGAIDPYSLFILILLSIIISVSRIGRKS